MGCRILFGVASGTGHTGRYLMRTTPLIRGVAQQDNVVLSGWGGSGVSGLEDATGVSNQVRPTPEIIVGSRVWGVQVNNPTAPLDATNKIHGITIQGLGFEDAIGQAFGGVALLGEVDGPYLDNVSMLNFTNGSCLYLDGGASGTFVQIGTIHKIHATGCKYGIRSLSNTSDIEIDGGSVAGSNQAGGIGLDFEANPLGSLPPKGNIRVHDIATRDFALAHMKFVDIPGVSIVQVKEEDTANSSIHGFGIDLESNLATSSCTNTRIAFPAIGGVQTGIQVGSNCISVDIYKPVIVNLDTGGTTIIDKGTNTSSVTDDWGVTLGMGTGSIANGRSVNIVVPNETVTGTVANQTAILATTNCPSGSAVCAVSPPAVQTNGIIGVVIAGAGTSGNAIVAVSGLAQCIFDSLLSVTAGGYAVVSNQTAGQCRYSATRPTATTEIFGFALDSASSAHKLLRIYLNLQNQ